MLDSKTTTRSLPACLAGVQRHVGVAQQVVGRRLLADRDADAGRDEHTPAAGGVHLDRLAKHLQKALGHQLGSDVERRRVEEDDELVSSHPPNGIALPHHTGQARGDRAQQLVTGRMTERVVDLLEAVDVDVERCRGAHRPPSPGQQLGRAVEHERSVGELRQRAVQRSVTQLTLGAEEITLREELPQQHQSSDHRRTDRQPDPLIQRRAELRTDRQTEHHPMRDVRHPPREAHARHDLLRVRGARARMRLRRAPGVRREGVERETDHERDVDDDPERIRGVQEEPAVGHVADDHAGEARDHEPERPARRRGGRAQQDVGCGEELHHVADGIGGCHDAVEERLVSVREGRSDHEEPHDAWPR
jgi:hypothetical protein